MVFFPDRCCPLYSIIATGRIRGLRRSPRSRHFFTPGWLHAARGLASHPDGANGKPSLGRPTSRASDDTLCVFAQWSVWLVGPSVYKYSYCPRSDGSDVLQPLRSKVSSYWPIVSLHVLPECGAMLLRRSVLCGTRRNNLRGTPSLCTSTPYGADNPLTHEREWAGSWENSREPGNRPHHHDVTTRVGEWKLVLASVCESESESASLALATR